MGTQIADKSILLIEPDADDTAALRNDLAELGAAVTVSRSREEAALLAREGFRPDAVFVTWNNGGMDTAKFTTVLKEEYSDSPFILIVSTGSWLPEYVVDALGVQATIEKPFSVPELSDVLGQALRDASRRSADLSRVQENGAGAIDDEGYDTTSDGPTGLEASEEPQIHEPLASNGKKKNDTDELPVLLPTLESDHQASRERQPYDGLAAAETEQTEKIPPSWQPEQRVIVPGEYVELSEQRIDFLVDVLRTYAQSQKHMILLLSQGGVLIAHAGNISYDVAAALALQVDRELHVGADQATEWYYSSKQIRSDDNRQDAAELYAMRVAGDLILSMYSGVSASRTMLRAMALEVADALALIVMALKTGELNPAILGQADDSEFLLPDEDDTVVVDERPTTSSEPRAVPNHMNLAEHFGFSFGDDLDWLTLDEEPSAEKPSEPAKPHADAGIESLLDQIRTEEIASSASIEQISAQTLESPEDSGFDELLEDIREDAQSGATAPTESYQEAPDDPQLVGDEPDNIGELEVEASHDEVADEVSSSSILLPTTSEEELPDASQLARDGLDDIITPEVQDVGKVVEPETEHEKEEALYESNGGLADTLGAPQPSLTDDDGELVGPRSADEQEEVGEDEEFSVADSVFARLGANGGREQVDGMSPSDSAMATEMDELDSVLWQDDLFAEAVDEDGATSDPEGPESPAAALFDEDERETWREASPQVNPIASVATEDHTFGLSRLNELATHVLSFQDRALESVMAWAKTISKDVTIQDARAHRRLGTPRTVGLVAVVGVAALVIGGVALGRDGSTASHSKTKPARLTQAHDAEALGFSVDLPEGWLVEEYDATETLPPGTVVTFAASDSDALDALEQFFNNGAPSLKGPVFVGIARSLGDQEETDPAVLLSALQADWPTGEMQTESPVSMRIGGKNAVTANFSIQNTRSDTVVEGRLVTAVWAGQVGYLIGAAPADQWDDYAPTFDAIVESIELSLPSGVRFVDREPVGDEQPSRPSER